ncbi:AAA family ATPase [Caminibacter mediatlanticus TB-2]|uniref:AAA family ATPase n=1 Tax=Caminibacter mediatlanticus TB-2 TaxID=391592 RepID=A0ABX5VCT2_9BACT|nr:AAA family ATPase [Caminibacter mediatlanticus]QCT95025.1 AAA family ATPase [Caminibacter mediatlanticus TB-2]
MNLSKEYIIKAIEIYEENYEKLKDKCKPKKWYFIYNYKSYPIRCIVNIAKLLSDGKDITKSNFDIDINKARELLNKYHFEIYENKTSINYIEEIYRLFKELFLKKNKNLDNLKVNEIYGYIIPKVSYKWDSEASLKDFIYGLYSMFVGKKFSRNLNNEAYKFFINKICNDFPDLCENAKLALRLHEDYIKNINKNENYLNKESFYSNKDVSYILNQILYGPPGTGKTYKTIELAVEIADKDFYEKNKDKRDEIKKRFNELKNRQISFITFHQSFSYEDFIEGIKPDLSGNQIRYKIEDGVFKRISNLAKENSDKNYVLIIDEINRGNIAKIFGELITLIEEDKRLGKKEELTTILPYSKSEFGVPSNLYIIGTMNTADRSLVYIDSALRRRFVFKKMYPKPELLGGVDGIDLKEMLEKINEKIVKFYDKDHQIGHSYFMKVKNVDDLKEVLENKILPLLEEYFFDDEEKIKDIFGEIDKDKIIENFKNANN